MSTLQDLLAAVAGFFSRLKSFVAALLTCWVSPSTPEPKQQHIFQPREPSLGGMWHFLREAEALFLGPVSGRGLAALSDKLKTQFQDALQSHPDCMLPSYNHQLPTGREQGQFLALDVGGSTLRVALVELRSRGAQARDPDCGIVQLDAYRIDSNIRLLRGNAFFDWMADRICETVAKGSTRGQTASQPLLMGMAWSFPIECVLLSSHSVAFLSYCVPVS